MAAQRTHDGRPLSHWSVVGHDENGDLDGEVCRCEISDNHFTDGRPWPDDSRPTDDDRNSAQSVMDIANTSDLPEWALTQLRGAAATAVFAERMRERGRWLKALDDSSLPHTYRRMLVVLALGRCDNCDGDPARCKCDES